MYATVVVIISTAIGIGIGYLIADKRWRGKYNEPWRNMHDAMSRIWDEFDEGADDDPNMESASKAIRENTENEPCDNFCVILYMVTTLNDLKKTCGILEERGVVGAETAGRYIGSALTATRMMREKCTDIFTEESQKAIKRWNKEYDN